MKHTNRKPHLYREQPSFIRTHCRTIIVTLLGWITCVDPVWCEPTNVLKKPLEGSQVNLFELTDVRITGGQMKSIQDLSHKYLLTLEPDRLLSWFRREAGLTPLAQPYPQWESVIHDEWSLAGHIMGFYLSGMSMMYQTTGDPAILERLRYSIHGLREAQDAGGDGYVAATRIGRHVFEDVAAGNFETSNPMINKTWEPVYVMNKLMLGLYDAYTLCGIDEARTVLTRLADWFGQSVIDKLDHEGMQKLLVCEHGSINESYIDVYRLTGEERYLRWAERLNDEDMWVPLSQGKDILQGWHANTQIPKFTGFVAVGRANGDKRMLDAAHLFWDIVLKNHTWVNGGNSCGEHFFAEDQYIEKVEATGGPESCNSVNMMRLTEALYQWDGEMSRVDYYERVLLNHILGNFDPEMGMSCYYTSMRPGQYKVYADPYGCFWCCVGTGLQAPAKLAKMVYAYQADTLFVNMFVPTTLEWKERGFAIEQQTSYPDADRSTLIVQRGGRVALAIRCPYWVEQGSMRIKVNGKNHHYSLQKGSRESKYIVLCRDWQEGDRIDLSFRPVLDVQPLKKFNQYVSIQYGAMVMAQKIDNHGLTHHDFVSTGSVAGKALPQDEVTTLVGNIASIKKSIHRAKGDSLTLLCNLPGTPKSISLVPFTRLLFDRYEVYFPCVDTQAQLDSILSPGSGNRESYSPTPEQLARYERLQIDQVKVTDDESEREHRMESYFSSTGEDFGQHWRHATDGGFFMYQMRCLPDKPIAIAIRFRQDDAGARLFDLQVDGRTIHTFDHRHPKEDVEKPLYYEEVEIPEELTHGKTHITVKFNAHNHNLAGGIFDLRTIQNSSIP
ncbi:MAG: glycoside hydrolase family 127 protein [Bacteroidaceae bacterium]|nr:glycoside hydrolase family 127 protein [Bacteroidaceae bacterium]